MNLSNSVSKVTQLPLKCKHHEVGDFFKIAIHIASSKNSHPEVFVLADLKQLAKFAGERPWWSSLLVKVHVTFSLQNNSFEEHL